MTRFRRCRRPSVGRSPIPIKDALGKTIRYGLDQDQNVADGSATLWWRVDGQRLGQVLSFDNGTAWFDAIKIEVNGEPYLNPKFDFDFESPTLKGFSAGDNAGGAALSRARQHHVLHRPPKSQAAI